MARPLLTAREAARALRVAPDTVINWHKAGRLFAIRTPGGQYRFRACDIAAMLSGEAPRDR